MAQDMLHGVCQVFQATLSPHENVRKQAEEQLKQLEHAPGYLQIVLQIVAKGDVDVSIRQAAAIYFKNQITRVWDPYPSLRQSMPQLNENERQEIRNHLVAALGALPPNMRKSIDAALATILSADYPEKWPAFKQHCVEYLSSNDLKVVAGGLRGTYEIVKIFRWRTAEKRGPLLQVIAELFPKILQIATSLQSHNDEEMADMLRICLKIYYGAIQFDMASELQESENLVPWGQLFLSIIQKQVPRVDVDDLPTNVWWKAKKKAYQCLNKIFARYGNPALLAKRSKHGAFAKMFITNFAPNIFQVYLGELEKHVNKQVIMAPKTLYFAITFLGDSLRHKITWALLKPHVSTVVSQVIFPLLCFSEADEEQWEADPIEFVQTFVDAFNDYGSPVAAATNLLTELVQYRKKPCFVNILSFIHDILSATDAANLDKARASQKYGALYMLECLSGDILAPMSPMRDQFEAFFQKYVCPEFASQLGFMRARACRFFVKMSNFEFVDPKVCREKYFGWRGFV